VGKRKIGFMPMSEEISNKLNPPASSKKFVPKWYKDSTAYIRGKMKISNTGINKDIKLCVPFLDAMTSGYCVELSCDIHISRGEDGVNFFWHEEPFPMQSRPPGIARLLPRPAGHSETLYAWSIHWASITPPGYSAIFCHPLNRYDLPFITTSGIVDTDKYHPGGEIPFFLRSDFSGVIPAGTPIVQIIPFKRDSWSSDVREYDSGLISRLRYSVGRVLSGGYAKFFWSKKHFE
jgi:hypothetical protein